MASYLVFMVSSIVAMAKKIKEQPIVAAVMLAVTAYAIQAVVNINLPIANANHLTASCDGSRKKEECRKYGRKS